jgi:tRNA-dihydrouridine synthase B
MLESTTEQLAAVDRFFETQHRFGERLQYRPASIDAPAMAA